MTYYISTHLIDSHAHNELVEAWPHGCLVTCLHSLDVLKHWVTCFHSPIISLQTEEGHTPLFFTIEKNESRNIQLLVQHPRVDLKMVDAKGFNSLHFAAIKNSR